ncbi:LysR substrate-binding domain-containing protein [Pseudomonas citri]|uniref:LysR substrate-binding domain-containing protein n=1 Tax=Pseudomonas citri TaxID=2978349 RepID=UPI0021B51AC2|nr:LysR substrate-binding domain-containing protein [Pseudomonas citri]
MDLSSLAIFETVASELSITRAATALGRAQSNVTTRIQALEQQVGAELFIREGKRLRLTERGNVFLAYSRRIRAMAEEAIQVLHPGEPQGALRIGAMESTAAIRLPSILGSFHGAWPRVGLNLVTGTSKGLVEQLLEGGVDCALVALTPEEQLASSEFLLEQGLEGIPVFQEELVLLTPSNLAPNDFESVSLAAFSKGCTYRLVAQRWLAAQGQSMPRTILEVGSYHAMFACVTAGQSICIMPRSLLALQKTVRGIQLIPVGPVETWLVCRRGYSTAAFEAFKDALLSAGTEADTDTRSG